ncbi:glycosyltransferase family 1 protein [Variovorax dokdonensis]|uniref:Glycosyltransferase family 1 protein n=1 Tax=Variovorax dokdonensis TaxID=344883 RepID=A0ABT7N793_9BURK|nr:glycosyltransferase family 1 protein [Variovorax dokdonensis]MDM0043816.1 glycosyltransferase family 1 protein [Variovorax dokdonensis]
MKVLLIGNYAPDDQKSMVAFTGMLERELPRLGCEVRVRVPPPLATRLPMPRPLRKWAGYVDKFVFFPPTLGADARWADVVHVCDHSNAMYLPRLAGHPTVLTCHDVIAIRAARGLVTDWHTGWTGRIFQRLIANGIGHAERVACVSESTRNDVLALNLAQPERLSLVPLGLNNEFGPLPPDRIRESLTGLGVSPDEAYLLHVGHEHPRKNRMAVLKAFLTIQQEGGDAAPVRSLVFVGSALTQEMIALAAQHPDAAKRIHVLRDVPHDRLRALYCGATALLFPSLQEGFGWPIIEAQASGCPVFASDLAPMNDIGGDAAEYIDPHDPDAIARSIMDSASRLARMRERGLENAAQYTAARMAARYLDLYRGVLAAHASAKGSPEDRLHAASRH